MRRQIIAICGLKRCGKDTLADYIVDKYGFVKVKIADPLKQICKNLFQLSEDQVETDAKEVIDPRWGVAPRRLMQFVGTEMFQYKLQELLPAVGRHFWIQQMTTRHPDHNIVISDMRFLHEYEFLKATGDELIVVKIERNSSTYDEHCSEKEWQDIPSDIVIQNNTTPIAMFEQFNQWAKGKGQLQANQLKEIVREPV